MTTGLTEREPIRRRKLADEVAARLEQMIAAGRFGEGDQLPSERALMAHFGVGRPAVREALQALQGMGLVAITSGERARVTRPTAAVLVGQLSGAARHLLAAPEGVRHFQEARLLFEVALARHAATAASPADIAALGEALAANRAQLDDLAAFNRTDVAFHYMLAVIPGNPIFTALHQAMVEWLVEQRSTTLRHPGAAAAALAAHEAIYEAIAARDPDRAEAAMRDHLGYVGAVYWQRIDERRDDGAVRDFG